MLFFIPLHMSRMCFYFSIFFCYTSFYLFSHLGHVCGYFFGDQIFVSWFVYFLCLHYFRSKQVEMLFHAWSYSSTLSIILQITMWKTSHHLSVHIKLNWTPGLHMTRKWALNTMVSIPSGCTASVPLSKDLLEGRQTLY